ncbi:MAG: CocE/NonD family hydrolase [Calditrichaeota bacterium]|nr:CocE/NonD family hydrolase [Calditrichota bacterium]
MKKYLYSFLVLFFSYSIIFAGQLQETYMVPMRDGVKLATDVYRPDDDAAHPVVLYRTPYNKTSDKLSDSTIKLLKAMGYAYVTQDLRGRYASEGTDSVFVTDGWGALQDGYDTIEWLTQQNWCNGKIGELGASASGITTYRAVGALHPNLVCAVAIVAPTDFYNQVVYPGGEFRKSLPENWTAGQGSQYMISYFLQFPYYTSIWEKMNLLTRTDKIKIPILHIGGWYDCFSEGPVTAFASLHSRPGVAPQKLLMGPWTHTKIGSGSQVGQLQYPDASYDVENYVLPWLDHWLRGTQNGVIDKPDVVYYLMGDPDKENEIGCQWIHSDTWPPPEIVEQTLYLTPSDRLADTKPTEDSDLSFRFDPQHPVPTVGGNNLTIDAGPYDQREVNTRDDVLGFESKVLVHPLRVEGNVRSTLYISSNRPDTDFTLKLIDVYPDGREMLVTDGIKRARFRRGVLPEDVTLLTPGATDSLEIELPPTAIVFNSGHKIKVCISSGNYPRYEVNPNTANAPNDRSNPQVATNTVYIGGNFASRIDLPVYPTPSFVSPADGVPKMFTLFRNFPNPFNSSTNIHYKLDHPGYVSVRIFNMQGRLVDVLTNEFQNEGNYVVKWDGRTVENREAASGVYLYRLKIGRQSKSMKMLLLR